MAEEETFTCSQCKHAHAMDDMAYKAYTAGAEDKAEYKCKYCARGNAKDGWVADPQGVYFASENE
jgi:hypothetical protein